MSKSHVYQYIELSSITYISFMPCILDISIDFSILKLH